MSSSAWCVLHFSLSPRICLDAADEELRGAPGVHRRQSRYVDLRGSLCASVVSGLTTPYQCMTFAGCVAAPRTSRVQRTRTVRAPRPPPRSAPASSPAATGQSSSGPTASPASTAPTDTVCALYTAPSGVDPKPKPVQRCRQERQGRSLSSVNVIRFRSPFQY